jgi:hypothetical protein
LRTSTLARRLSLGLALLAGLPCSARAGDIPQAQLILEVTPPGRPGRYPDAAPPRFVLLDGGRFFVGGSTEIAEGEFDAQEWKEFRKRLERIRKLYASSASFTFGAGAARYRLVLRHKAAVEIVATGDPASSREPVAVLIAELAAFDHPSLRFVAPEAYLLVAREGSLPGGCRPWAFPVTPADASAGVRSIPAAAARDWPTGADAASVCAGDKRYIVTLRPLLPGERP